MSFLLLVVKLMNSHSSKLIQVGTFCVNLSVKQPNIGHRTPSALSGYGNWWLVESVKELSRQQPYKHEFPPLVVRGLVIRGVTSSLLIETFSWQVPISGLVPLSLAYDSGVQFLIRKESQCENIRKQIKTTLSYKTNWFDHQQQKPMVIFNFPDYSS